MFCTVGLCRGLEQSLEPDIGTYDSTVPNTQENRNPKKARFLFVGCKLYTRATGTLWAGGDH
jgi:hypothetical protein